MGLRSQKRNSTGRSGAPGKVLGSRQMGTDRRLGVYSPVANACNSPHPDPDRALRIRGVLHFLTCERPPGHKVQHRAKTRAGYVWWS